MTNQRYIYGAMGVKYALEAPDKYIAYATMNVHFQRKAHLILIYEPEECLIDNWVNVEGKIAHKLDEIYGGEGEYDKFCDSHIPQIKECFQTIYQVK